MTRPAIARTAAAYAASILVLCLPALWNQFPLMYDDVGGYLDRWPSETLGLGRSTVYGLLLWITRSAAFVPVILLQALVTIFVVDRALAALAPRERPPWLLPVVIAAIAATSGVALFVSKAIPDAWEAPGVLALHLLAWHAERLTIPERVALAAIVALAGASHMAMLGVMAGLSLVYLMIWLARRNRDPAPASIGLALAAVWSGLLLLVIGNTVVTGSPALASDGEIILFGRMVEDGSARQILSEECPRADWRLCDDRDALPAYAEAFIFDADSPLQKIGGDHDPRVHREIVAIIERSLARHPLEHLRRAIALTATQLVDVGVGGVIEPLMSAHTRWVLSRNAPSLLPAFDAARQQSGDIDLGGWSDWIVVPVSLAGSFCLPLLAALAWRRGLRRDAMLPAAVFLALLGNAAICGILVGSNDRYQARLVWLAPLAVGLTLWAMARTTRQKST
jgi:hypothetical protein